MLGYRSHCEFLENDTSFSVSHALILSLGLILSCSITFSPAQVAAVKCQSTNISAQHQHCRNLTDGVHGLDCWTDSKQESKMTCAWQPGSHTSQKTYTLIVQQHDDSGSVRQCTAHCNITDITQNDIFISQRLSMTVEVIEHSEVTDCTKAVFRGSPKSMRRCGPPQDVSFRRHAGSLLVAVTWPQKERKYIKKYSVRLKEQASLEWSMPLVQCQSGEECRVGNLNSSALYVVQVQCVHSTKCSQCVWSDAYTIPSELTEQPIIVNLTSAEMTGAKGLRLLFVSWKFPSQELLDRYNVTIAKASGEPAVEVISTTQPQIRLVLSYSAFRLNISAVNNASTSPAVSQIIPQHEEDPSMGSGKVSVVVHSSTSFTITWQDKLIRTYVCYSAEWMKRGHKTAYKSFYQNRVNNRTLSPLPEPLEPYTRYSITLHTRPDKETCNMKHINNSESTYGSTQFYYIEGAPVSAPTNISSYNVTLNSMVLEWVSMPEEDIRGFLLGYIIYYTEYDYRGASTETNVTVDPELNSYELVDLKSDTAYEVQMSGFTRAGAGPRSPPSLFKTNYESYSVFRGPILGLAVFGALLLFGSPLIKRAKVFLWPSIPNPGDSHAVQKIYGANELELLESINTLKVEEWDTNSLQIIEKEEVPVSPLPSMLPLLNTSQAEEEDPERTSDWFQHDTGDTNGDIATTGTISDIQQTDIQTPATFMTGYTTMEMFQQAMPKGMVIDSSVTQDRDPQEADEPQPFVMGKSGLDYVRQFSTSPILDNEEIVRTVWKMPAESDRLGTQSDGIYCP